jgi:hypothetical protein
MNFTVLEVYAELVALGDVDLCSLRVLQVDGGNHADGGCHHLMSKALDAAVPKDGDQQHQPDAPDDLLIPHYRSGRLEELSLNQRAAFGACELVHKPPIILATDQLSVGHTGFITLESMLCMTNDHVGWFSAIAACITHCLGCFNMPAFGAFAAPVRYAQLCY